MNRDLLKIISIGVIIFLILISFTSTGQGFEKVSPSAHCKPFYHQKINITHFEIVFFPQQSLFDYEIQWEVHNIQSKPIIIKFTETWIYPNGSIFEREDYALLLPDHSLGVFQTCKYSTNQYGNYNFELTITDLEDNFLDGRSYSWIRRPYFFTIASQYNDSVVGYLESVP